MQPPNTVSEHHQTSTNTRGRQGLVPRHRHRRLPKQSKASALCASYICHHHLSLRKATSRVLDRSKASAKRFLLPANATQHTPSVEIPWHHAAKTHHHRCGRGHAAPPEDHHYPVTAPKKMPQQGERHRASPSSDPGDLDLGFPRSSTTSSRHVLQNDALKRGNNVGRRHHSIREPHI
jgi:hypothetical protein